MSSNKTFKNISEFGNFLSLTDLDMELVQQKKKLIQKLKKTRLDKKMSQTELAQILGTKQPAIARMESGEIGQVSLDFLIRIALVLGVSYTFKSSKAA
jgi:DNA-binding Xre family transcriptional regulator